MLIPLSAVPGITLTTLGVSAWDPSTEKPACGLRILADIVDPALLLPSARHQLQVSSISAEDDLHHAVSWSHQPGSFGVTLPVILRFLICAVSLLGHMIFVM